MKSFLLSLLRGSYTVARSGMNLAQTFTRPKKLHTSAADSGCLASLTAIFAWDGPIPRGESKCMTHELKLGHVKFALVFVQR